MLNIDFLKGKHCRWCSIEYYAKQPYGRDGFCSRAHRQAHHRAYNRYVTAVPDRLPIRKKR